MCLELWRGHGRMARPLVSSPPMQIRPPSRDVLMFVLIGAVLMIVLDALMFGEAPSPVSAPAPPPPVLIETPDIASPNPLPETLPEKTEEKAQVITPLTPLAPPPAPVLSPLPVRPKIAIVIDDMGMDVARSRRAMGLPGPLTLAFLPHALSGPKMAEEAARKGHTILLHAPMEAMGGNQGLGPMALMRGMEDGAFDKTFAAMIAPYPGAIGVNNHMGSRLTQDRGAMDRLMTLLKARGLSFLDSRTTAGSVAAIAAADSGVSYTVRDVFLDHQPTRDFVEDALAEVERIARKRGVAIAIGHPKDSTLDALETWIPALEEKGFDLVPISAVLTRPQGQGSPSPPE